MSDQRERQSYMRDAGTARESGPRFHTFWPALSPHVRDAFLTAPAGAYIETTRRSKVR
jgi:hypothetical protein